MALQYDGRMVKPETDNGQTRRESEHRGERRFHWQSALLLESVRRDTFSNWPVPYVEPDKLAQAGFFYLRTEDHVQCIFCQGIVGYWDPGDDPLTEHKKHFPNCPFITGSATGNIPRARHDNTSTEALYRFLDDYHTFRVSTTRPKPPKSAFQTDSALVSEAGQLVYPHFNTITNRLQSYSRWPKHVGLGPDVLAEAGFFSTGLADWVQCFHCGGGLHGWRSEDNPIVDHARFFPYCLFARGKLGEDAVNKTVQENPPPQSNSRPIKLSIQEVELLLIHPIAKRLLAMGLSPVSVKEALKRRIEDKGVICRTVTEALEYVFNYEEQQLKNSNTNNFSHDGSLLPYEMSVAASFRSGHSVQEHHNSQMEMERMRLLGELEILRHQVEIAEKPLLCRVCRNARVAIAFQPCYHLHLCSTCARPQDTCPSCGAVVRGTLKPIIG
ncbi:regulation of natural killer cell apoptotic process [Halocaridina rubra]|uniref:Regulation of natural killer cell apoptotic process n=1 Tax=Halocaridina rubra TaxID=373956 RepID=A0AAN8ZQG5_HALRR